MREWTRCFFLNIKNFIYYYFCCKKLIIQNKIIYSDKNYELIKKDRNHYCLNSEDLELIKKLEKKYLIEIIEIVNTKNRAC